MLGEATGGSLKEGGHMWEPELCQQPCEGAWKQTSPLPPPRPPPPARIEPLDEIIALANTLRDLEPEAPS